MSDAGSSLPLLHVCNTECGAKAALTMSIMVPFTDLIEVSRQATVMVFSLEMVSQT